MVVWPDRSFSCVDQTLSLISILLVIHNFHTVIAWIGTSPKADCYHSFQVLSWFMLLVTFLPKQPAQLCLLLWKSSSKEEASRSVVVLIVLHHVTKVYSVICSYRRITYKIIWFRNYYQFYLFIHIFLSFFPDVGTVEELRALLLTWNVLCTIHSVLQIQGGGNYSDQCLPLEKGSFFPAVCLLGVLSMLHILVWFTRVFFSTQKALSFIPLCLHLSITSQHKILSPTVKLEFVD